MNDGQMSHRRRTSPNSGIKKRKVSNSVEHKPKLEIYTPPDKYLKYYIDEDPEDKELIVNKKEEKIEENNENNGEHLITFKEEHEMTVNYEEERKLKMEQLELKKKEIDEIIIQLKEDEMIEKRAMEKRPLIIHLIPIGLIAFNFIWFYIIDSIINGDVSNFNGVQCNKLFHSFWVILDFYFWITIFLLASFFYDKTIAHFNETLEYIGVMIFIIVQVFHYVGILYFIIKISYAYSFQEPCNFLSTISYCWLNIYYIILIICIIFFVNEFVRVFKIYKYKDKLNKDD